MLPDLAFRITAQGATAQAFGQTRAQIDRMRGSMAQFRRDAGMARSLLAGFGVTLGVAGVAQLGRSIAGVVEEAGELVNTADRIGITTGALQELAYTAKLADVDMSTLNGNMEKFTRSLGDAAQGTGELKDLLDANNIALTNADGTARPVSEMLAEIADLMENAASAQDKMNIAIMAFGRGGAGMVNVLAGGSAKLREMAAEANATGVVIDDELLRKAEEVGDEWEKASLRMSTGWKSAVLEMIGSVEDFKGWLDQQAAGDSWLGKWLKGLKSLDVMTEEERLASFKETPSGLPKGRVGGAVWKPTVIPTKPDAATEKAAEKIKAVLDALDDQRAMLGMTERAQFIYNEQVKAGVEANSEAGQEIAAVAGALFDQQDALEETIARLDEIRAVARDVLGGFVDDMMQGATVTEALGNALQRLAQKLIDAGLDTLIENLFGAAGGASGGLLGGFLSLLFGGGKAGGGPLDPGKWYIAGEHGPEPIWGGGPGAFAAGYGPAGAAASKGAAGSSVIRLEVEEGPMFRPTIKQVSGEVSVQVSQAAVAQNNRAMERRQATAG